MTREIEFRAKDIHFNKWVYGYYHYLENSKEHCILEYGRHTSTAIDEQTIGQFTGLKAKNENKIFEGDIVKWYNELLIIKYGEYMVTRESNSIGEHFKVVQAFGWYGERQGDYIKSVGIDLDIVKYGEVIGNIHDNPELLKGRLDD